MTTHPAPIHAPNDYEATDSRALTREQARARRDDNIWIGIGAALTCAAVGWSMNANWSTFWRWPCIVGLCAMGIAFVLRSGTLDEARADRRWRRREAEHEEECRTLADACDELEEQLAAERDQHALELQAANETMRAEQRRADGLEVDLAYERLQHRRERSGPNTVQVVDLTPQQLKTDCRRFVELWQSTGKRPTRVEMMADGLTRARWDAMIVELRQAGVWEWDSEVDAVRMHLRLDARWAHPPTPRAAGRDGADYSSAGGAGLPPAQE